MGRRKKIITPGNYRTFEECLDEIPQKYIGATLEKEEKRYIRHILESKVKIEAYEMLLNNQILKV